MEKRKTILTKASNVIAFLLLVLGASMSLNAQSEPAIESIQSMAFQRRIEVTRMIIEDTGKNIQELELKLEPLKPLFDDGGVHKYKGVHTYVGPKQTSGTYSLDIRSLFDRAKTAQYGQFCAVLVCQPDDVTPPRWAVAPAPQSSTLQGQRKAMRQNTGTML
jgi:hypothetical protein